MSEVSFGIPFGILLCGFLGIGFGKAGTLISGMHQWFSEDVPGWTMAAIVESASLWCTGA